MTVAGQRLVPIRQGHLAVTTWGAGDPVVLLHPLALCGELWRPLGTTLAGQFAVYAPDLRGHGGTSWDGAEFSIADMADDLAQALDALDLGPVRLLGMSMGGGVAMCYAARHPDRVRSLVLADTTAWYGENARTAWAERAAKAATVARDRQVAFQVDRWFSDAFRDDHPDEVRRVVDLFVATDSAAHAAACRAMGALDARDLLPAVTAPTLVLVGEHDYATPPAMAEYLAGHISGATLKVLPDLRHMALIEQPELATTVLEFIR